LDQGKLRGYFQYDLLVSNLLWKGRGRTKGNRFITPETGDLRFTQTRDAFYILSLTEPVSPIIVDVPIPILSGDKISMIGAGNSTELDWSFTDGGDVSIIVPDSIIEAGKYAWAMKVIYLV